ncbi:tetratricopeptide repeat protein [Streptomyces sparsogenes]|uniref:tetratricopeptide repeat protein n=1 Tax=Streptomyces sparsogenes TaxID=67365 RepID=UPI0033CE3EC2
MDPQGNAIGGGARIDGPSVQARDVHGGIHLHTSPAPPPVRPPVPRQLLPVSSHFTDRKRDLAALDELAAAAPLIVVSGPAGVGKTALVSRWLRGTAGGEGGGDRFPDGHLYADLRGHSPDGPAPPTEVLGQFLRALGVGQVPAELAEQTALWRSVTAGLRLAVMLDNAYTAAQARPLLPGGEGSLAVVTSRARLTGLRTDGAVFHQLGLLDREAAVELLTRGIGRERFERDEAAAGKVAELCGGLPLAVCLASARLASRPRQPVRAMADALARDQTRLAVLTIEGETAVQSALDGSYAVLDEEAARLYRRLGLLPMPVFDTCVAAAACAVSPEEADRALDALVEANLLEDIGPDTFRFHDLVRLHARERATADESERTREETLRRVVDWHLATATEAQRRLTPAQAVLERDHVPPGLPVPFDDDAGALAWLDAHRTGLMAAARCAAEHGWDGRAWQLVDAMWPLFLRLRPYDLWIEAHELGLSAARRAGHPAAERQMLNSGAIGLRGAGRTADAISWYERSLAAARAAGDARDEGQALHGLGGCWRDAGRPREAVRHLEAAIEVWERCGYPRGAALARIILGEIALDAAPGSDPGVAPESDLDAGGGADLGARPDDAPGPASGARAAERAARYFERAHAGLLAVGDPYGAAPAQAFLGYAHALAGAYETGQAELERAERTFAEAGARHWQARALELSGRAAQAHGDPETARRRYEDSLALYTAVGSRDADRLRQRLDGLGQAGD